VVQKFYAFFYYCSSFVYTTTNFCNFLRAHIHYRKLTTGGIRLNSAVAAFGLAGASCVPPKKFRFSRSFYYRSGRSLSGNNSRHIVHTHVPLSPNSTYWVGHNLRMRR